MNRLFLCGDTHQSIDIDKLINFDDLTGNSLDKSDVLIICGDWGVIWDNSKKELTWKKWFDTRNWTTFVTFGNHEGYDLIEKFPIVDFMGGKAYKISDSIYGEIRGEIYTINGLKVLSMGGADSIDKELREKGVSWWEQEQISKKDLENAIKNLEKVDFKVDIVTTHCGGIDVCNFLGFKSTISDERLSYLFYQLDKRLIDYKHYCGHYHVDLTYNNHRILYDDVIEYRR